MSHAHLNGKPVPSNVAGQHVKLRPGETFATPGRLYTARRFGPLADELARIAPTLPKGTVIRSGGIRSLTNAVGFIGPNLAMQRATPRIAAIMRENPELADFVTRAARQLWGDLREADPVAARANEIAAERIHGDWLIGGTPWTSGVLNHGAALPYHNDNNNVSGTWSGMLWARHPAVLGGHLHVPELDLILECAHGQGVFFPGHGVSPMRDFNPTPNTKVPFRRWSLVFYCVNAFMGKSSAKESLKEARQQRTVLEDGLLERQRAQGLIADHTTDSNDPQD